MQNYQLQHHQFLTEFSQNFIEQVQRVLNIDGYLIYSIDNINRAYNYQAVNVSKISLDEYLNHKVENDPVSFSRFYNSKSNHVELLSHHQCDDEYSDFMARWKIQDTAEIFFRKRNGDPILGLSVIRENEQQPFTLQDQKMLDSFCQLSKKYFYHHADTLDKADMAESYSLTKKEIAVLEQLLNGINNSDIALKLNCSIATIKTHVQHIFQKIDVNNRQELICKFLR